VTKAALVVIDAQQTCVDTTARQAAHLGFDVTILSDASAARSVNFLTALLFSAEAVHQTHPGGLSGSLAEVKIL
jgi:nicotinamidase-related amidase